MRHESFKLVVDFADRCDMKVSRWVLALFLVSAPVPMCGSAYADGCGGANCKSEDSLDQSAPPAASRTAPAPNRSAPVGLLTAPEPTADTCGGSGCKDDSDDNVGTDDIDDNTGAASGHRKALPSEIVRDGCSGANC